MREANRPGQIFSGRTTHARKYRLRYHIALSSSSASFTPDLLQNPNQHFFCSSAKASNPFFAASSAMVFAFSSGSSDWLLVAIAAVISPDSPSPKYTATANSKGGMSRSPGIFLSIQINWLSLPIFAGGISSSSVGSSMALRTEWG